MKKFPLILALLFIGSIYAQDSTYVEQWNNNVLKIERKYQNEKKQGIWKKWNDKGELIEKAKFEQGKLTLKTTYEYYTHTKNLIYEKKIFNPDNKLIEKRLYSSQNSEAYTMKSYYNNGKIKSSGHILNKKKEGKWITYDEYGIVISKNKFKTGIHVNNPNYQLIKEAEKEKKRAEKVKKDSIEKEILIKKTSGNSNFSKGYYTDKKGEIINCYFKDGSIESGKPTYKIDIYEKEKLLRLNDVKTLNFKEKTYTVIDIIKLKACSMIGTPVYENKITTNIIKGSINLYSTTVRCSVRINNEDYGTDTSEVFIVKKGLEGEFKEMILQRNKFRDLIKILVEDDEKIIKETTFEELEYKDLISIISQYNSSRKDTLANANQPTDVQKSNLRKNPSCLCTSRLNRKIFELNTMVKTRKECCLIMTGLSKTSQLKVYRSDPNTGGKKLLSRDTMGKNNIKLKLSTLESGTYYMSFSENRYNGWATLLIK